VYPIFDRRGRVIQLSVFVRDITRQKRAEESLKKAHEQLERRVKERTADLFRAKNNLEEVNTALRVLLRQRDEDKAELEEKVLANVKNLMLPYLEKLKNTSLDSNQRVYVSILESNLNEIILPFSRKLSYNYLGLTPTEIRVANLIKDERTTKEIAEIMNLSGKTVETHRTRIRKKLGIKHKKVNLRSYLSSSLQ
jgi:DNA-binding CsgD family transcriptional regulator